MSYIDPGAYTAVKSGTVTDEWGTHRVIARRSRWVLSYEQMRDPLIRDLFGLTDGSAPSRSTHSVSRSAPVSRSQFVRRDRDSGREIPDLIREDPQFPLELTVSPSVRGEISESLADCNELLSLRGVETGGYLFGQFRLRHAYLAGTTGRVHDRSPNQVTLDSSVIRAAQDALRADGYSSDLVGDWHAHPRPGSTEPSDQDLVGWLGMRDLCREMRYVGVIVTPDRTWGWLQPVLTAWCVRRENRRPICERGVVVGG